MSDQRHKIRLSEIGKIPLSAQRRQQIMNSYFLHRNIELEREVTALKDEITRYEVLLARTSTAVRLLRKKEKQYA